LFVRFRLSCCQQKSNSISTLKRKVFDLSAKVLRFIVKFNAVASVVVAALVADLLSTFSQQKVE